MKKTPLYENHVALGARMVPYAGFEMPVQYEGIREETLAVRKKCGIFDVSHMGEIKVKGKDSTNFLNWLLTRRVDGKASDQITYAILCQEDGGTVDDLLVYPRGEDSFLLVVNAANKDKDMVHITESLKKFSKKFADGKADVEVIDISDSFGQIAVQGPDSVKYVKEILEKFSYGADIIEKLEALKRYRYFELDAPEGNIILSRTGYTGENGFELYTPVDATARFFSAFIEAGVVPCGLGSRDALRLEAGMPLYGHELSETINPLDSNLGFFVDFEHEFQGEVMKEKNNRRLISLKSQGKAIPRDGYKIFYNGEEVGVVTSGSFSPTLGVGIANALVAKDAPEMESVEMEIRRRREPFIVVKSPFIK